ncbi:MAG: hypothetical protein IPH13_22200 [Planctomycetes bacterium]|nr:hypothetical protein [Planctomycetota bacterium]
MEFLLVASICLIPAALHSPEPGSSGRREEEFLIFGIGAIVFATCTIMSLFGADAKFRLLLYGSFMGFAFVVLQWRAAIAYERSVSEFLASCSYIPVAVALVCGLIVVTNVLPRAIVNLLRRKP